MVEDTHAVVVRKGPFRVLYSEVFVMSTSPEGLHLIVIVGIGVRVAVEEHGSVRTLPSTRPTHVVPLTCRWGPCSPFHCKTQTQHGLRATQNRTPAPP